MALHLELGERGEEATATYLATQGFEVAGRRVRIGRTDIDIVALRDGVLHFVEVKSRTFKSGYLTESSPAGNSGTPEAAARPYSPDSSNPRHDFSPATAVIGGKLERMEQAAERYMAQHSLECELSIDLASVLIGPGGETRIDFTEAVNR